MIGSPGFLFSNCSIYVLRFASGMNTPSDGGEIEELSGGEIEELSGGETAELSGGETEELSDAVSPSD